MTVSRKSIDRVDSHWAVEAVGDSPKERKQARLASEARLVEDAIGSIIELDLERCRDDAGILGQLALAYEVAAMEGLTGAGSTVKGKAASKLRELCAAGAWRAFGILRLDPLPEADDERIYHVLHLSALAYCAGRWSDLRRWYEENPGACKVPDRKGATWQHRLLLDLFDCWVRLFRKQKWEDLEAVGKIVAKLRREQSAGEDQVRRQANGHSSGLTALHLLGLYHWARATELLASYVMQGEPVDVDTQLRKHFDAALDAVSVVGDVQLELLMRWLSVASREMVAGSIWSVVRSVNSKVTDFTKQATRHQALFELLPPQKAAVQKGGLLDQANTAVVIDMPTSGGKTLLAEFRILQALNQGEEQGDWVAYVAPTKALVSQLTQRLRRSFEPIGVRVEQLTGAVEIDAFEEELLKENATDSRFQVLVATPEKLQLVLRKGSVSRPLVLLVMDEAHNIEHQSRGLRIELLLATVRQEYRSANFLLLMPFVENAEEVADWLAGDIGSGRAISIGTTPWQPNERIVGTYWAEPDDSEEHGWCLKYETVSTSVKAIHLHGKHTICKGRPFGLPKSEVLTGKKQKGLTTQTAAIAHVMSERGTSIAVVNRTDLAWSMARHIRDATPEVPKVRDEVRLVQDFIRDEVGPEFELVEMLAHGVGVHHAGLSDEIRSLMEWLTEERCLKVLCATSTIAQGINFPVDSVFLQSRFVGQEHRSVEISAREFWNLAGRAGRVAHSSVGMVGMAAGKSHQATKQFLRGATKELGSMLVKLLNDLDDRGRLNDLDWVIEKEQWDDFRCFVAHLLQQGHSEKEVLQDMEQTLRNTFGYGILMDSPDDRHKADRLLDVTRKYVEKIARTPGLSKLADATGFSVENVKEVRSRLGSMKDLSANDWLPEALFGESSKLDRLCEVMLEVSQLSDSLNQIKGRGEQHERLAQITKAWVNGRSIQDIANTFFSKKDDPTDAITKACKGIYGTIVNANSWGLAALSQMSDVDFESLDEAARRRLNNMPAMVYHGVDTEESVLMRMNSVPRGIAGVLGKEFGQTVDEPSKSGSVAVARDFLNGLGSQGWGRVVGDARYLSGEKYWQIWEVLSGKK